jgi:hypothetical protein
MTSISANILANGTSSFVPSAPSQRTYILNTTNNNYIRNAILTQDSLTLTYVTTSVVFPLNTVGGLYQVASTLVSALSYPPIIYSQPTSSTVVHANPVSFAVSASAEFNSATFQWASASATALLTNTFTPLTNSAIYTGVTSSFLTNTNTVIADSGSAYKCIVSGIGGTVSSSYASLYVT